MFGGYGRYRVSRWLPHHAMPFVSPMGNRRGHGVERCEDHPRGRALEAFLLTARGPASYAALLGSDLPAVERSTRGGDVGRLLRTDWEALTGDARHRDAARRFVFGADGFPIRISRRQTGRHVGGAGGTFRISIR